MIAIIDYDAGNIKSVEKAFQYIGEDTVVSRDKDVILSADKVVLPGVGSFGDAMEKLRDYDLIDTINKVVENERFLEYLTSRDLRFHILDGTLWNLLITEDYLKALKNSLMFILYIHIIWKQKMSR